MANVLAFFSGLISWRGARTAVLAVSMAVLAVMGVIWMNFAAISAPAKAAPDAQSAPAGLVGWLDVTPKADPGGKGMHLTIAGRAFALAEVKGRYTIDVRRRGKGGVSNSRQSGDFTIAPGETAALSRTTINAQTADWLEIELRLSVGDAEVFVVTMRPAGTAGNEGEEDGAEERTL